MTDPRIPDSFDFKAQEADPSTIALLLPAVQKVETTPEPIDDFAGHGDDGSSEYTLVELLEIRGTRRRQEDEDDGWIDVLTMNQGVTRSVEEVDGLF